jgi:hypothetical protein
MQVSRRLLHLDKSIEQASTPCVHRALAQRPVSTGHRARIFGAVFPPVNGGPHCSASARRLGSCCPKVFPPVNGGPPLQRRVLQVRPGPPRPVFPSGQGRAPLRSLALERKGLVGADAPADTGGLHCGTDGAFGPISPIQMFPADLGRAPLRCRVAGVLRAFKPCVPAGQSAAGSIAARSSSHGCRGSSGYSRR